MPKVSGSLTVAGAPAGGRIVRAYRRDTGALLRSGVVSSGPTAGDPDWNKVSLYLKMNGADDGVLFADSGSRSKAVTVTGSAKTVTAISKFGGSSGTFPSYPGQLTIAHDADFDLTGDFTISAWVYPAAPGGNRGIVTKRNPTGAGAGTWGVWLDSENKFAFSDIDASTSVITPSPLPTGVWTYVEASREGSTIRVFQGGALAASATSTNTFLNTYPLVVGNWDELFGGPFTGNISHVQVVKGKARNTSAYAAPTAAPFDVPDNPLALGQYELDLAGYAGEIQVVVLDAAGGTFENDLIHRTTGY